MYRYRGKPPSFPRRYVFVLLPPLLITGLFYLLRNNTPLMDRWVYGIMGPVMQGVGRILGPIPFAVGEALVAAAIALLLLLLLRTLFLLFRTGSWADFGCRLLAVLCILLWVWGLFCWLWNCTYYATGFAEQNGLNNDPYTSEQLVMTTLLFASQAAELSDKVPRGEDLSFAADIDRCFERSPGIYEQISQLYPQLELTTGQAKKLTFSRLQSVMGYSGVYLPFTGEANVNADIPACMIPATIAHEMSHQRMVAAEEEANFVGILACITSDDVEFQYSGYLMGLVELSNALYKLSPALMREIMAQTFTEELSTDWNENYHYWNQFSSPVEEKVNEVADEVYDAFLKSNGQSLGLLSYGACVDLLVNYFYPYPPG